MAADEKRERLWIDVRHSTYDEAVGRRRFARDHYTGRAHTVSLKEANTIATQEVAIISNSALNDTPGIRVFDTGPIVNNGTYLFRKAQGETGLAFLERAKITRFPSYYSSLIDSYTGGVFSVESKAEREFGEPLGNPADKGSLMFSLRRDIDGTGLGWGAALVQKTQDIMVEDLILYKADRINAESPIRIFSIDPDRVINWREEEGLMVELLMEEFRLIYPKGGIFGDTDGAFIRKYYILYDLDGWRRWRLEEEFDDMGNKTGKRKLVFEEGRNYDFPFWTSPAQERQRLPFGRLSSPLGRDNGYQMAWDHNALYNLLSDARWILRVVNHPRLTGEVTDEQWNRSIEALREGMNAMQGKWQYISPPSENAREGYNVFNKEVGQYYISNNQRMSAPSIERSATEVLFNEAAGRTSNLTLIAGAVDEMENDWMFLASQLEAPTSPDSWWSSTVSRSSDFKPIDDDLNKQAEANIYAAVVNSLPAEIAAEVARDGFSDSVIEKLTNLRTDIEDDLEQ